MLPCSTVFFFWVFVVWPKKSLIYICISMCVSVCVADVISEFHFDAALPNWGFKIIFSSSKVIYIYIHIYTYIVYIYILICVCERDMRLVPIQF